VRESPVEALETVLYGSELVLNAAAQAGKTVLLGSSSEVYGRGVDGMCREDDALVFGPLASSRWGYGIAKSAVEHLALAYGRLEGLPVVIARIFNCSGPRQRSLVGNVLPRFVEQALSGGPITVYGDGSQKRSFCDVGEVATCLCKLADCEGARGKAVNVGSIEEVTIAELAERVRQEVAPKVAVKRLSYEKVYGGGFEDVARRLPDLTRLKELIGFEPTVGLTDIIQRVAADVLDRRERTSQTVSADDED